MANLNMSLDGTLSSFGIVRWADGHADTHDATGQRKLKRGNSKNLVLRWENMCRRIQLTAAFLYLNRVQKLTVQQAAYILGFDNAMLYIWCYKYPECSALWFAPEFNTLQRNVKVSLTKFLPTRPTVAYAENTYTAKSVSKKKFNPKTLVKKSGDGKLTSFVKEQIKQKKLVVEHDKDVLSAREKRQIKLAVDTLHNLRPDIRLAVMNRVTDMTLSQN